MPEARTVARKPTADWSLKTTAAVALVTVAPVDQPACRPTALGFGQSAGDDAGQPSQTGGAHRGLVAASPFRGTGRAPAVDVEDPAVAELEEMACGELGSGDVVGPDDVDPFSRDCAGDDDGRGLAADGREVGESLRWGRAGSPRHT